MDDRTFLLNILKCSPSFIKLALTSLTADSIEERAARIPLDVLTAVDSTFTALLEPVRQQQYFQARDLLVKMRSDLILLRSNLHLSLNSQGLFTCVLSYLAVLGDELYYRGGALAN